MSLNVPISFEYNARRLVTLVFFIGLLAGCHNPHHTPRPTPAVDSQYAYYSRQLTALEEERRLSDTIALRYADSLLLVLEPYAHTRQYNVMYARAQVRKGDVLIQQKRFEEACFHFYLGKRSLLPDSDSCAYSTLISDITGRLATVAYRQERYRESIATNHAAYKHMMRCGSGFSRFYIIQGTLDNLALGYSALGQADSALFYYNMALDYIRGQAPLFPKDSVFIEIARAVIYGNQGTAWLLKGDTALAEQAFLKNIAINSQPGHPEQDALITRVKLADLYLQSGRLDDTGNLLAEIAASPIPLPDRPRLKLLQIQAGYAHARNRPAEAYHLLQEYIRSRNSMDSANRPLMGTNFQLQIDLLHQRYEVDVLKRQGQLSNVYLVTIILLLLMALVILYVTRRSRKQARKHARESLAQNQQLVMMLEAVEKSNSEYAQLMRIVAHDLKNPLSVIYMLTELMTVQEGKPVEDLEMLQLIRGASTNMNTVIQELLSGKNTPDISSTRREEVDIRLLLQQSVDLLRYRANKKHQRLVAAKHPSCLVHINYEQIWRVINNLLVNAIKFSPEHTTISVEWTVQPTEVVIQVQDQGIGIPPEMQEQIFEQFSSAQRTGTSGEQPFGMGLYISRQIVEAHDGRIWLESTEGKGTTFFVALRR